MKPSKIFIIGSSPISLITALTLAKKKFNVTVIEKENILGGGWSYQQISNFKNVELGPHYIKERNNSYKKLLSLDVPLENIPNKVLWLKNFSEFNKYHYYYNYFKNQLSKLIGKEHKVKYIKDGSYSLIKVLEKKLNNNGVKIILGCQAKEINIENDEVSILTNIKNFSANKCVLFSGTKIQKITINEKIFNTDCEVKKYINLIILFKKKVIPTKSYFKILEPQIVSFVGDITPKNNSKNQILGLRINDKNQSELNIENILSEIRELSNDIKNENIIEYKFDTRLVPYRTIDQINDLNKICPNTLEFVYSADLTNGLANINL